MILPDPGFRCAGASALRDEPVAGTASTVRAFLLVEHAGSWGVNALRDARLPGDLGPRLRRASAETGVRVLLVRRPGRQPRKGHTTVFAAYAHPHRPWLERGDITDPHDILDLDLAAIRDGRSSGLDADAGNVYCVCTHGRHDACCAERGRPVASALSAAHPEDTWEVSHIGGDRFAGNLLVLPHGLYYGRLDAPSAVAVAGGHEAGGVRRRGRGLGGAGPDQPGGADAADLPSRPREPDPGARAPVHHPTLSPPVPGCPVDVLVVCRVGRDRHEAEGS
jgi:hypothetical protein